VRLDQSDWDLETPCVAAVAASYLATGHPQPPRNRVLLLHTKESSSQSARHAAAMCRKAPRSREHGMTPGMKRTGNFRQLLRAKQLHMQGIRMMSCCSVPRSLRLAQPWPDGMPIPDRNACYVYTVPLITRSCNVPQAANVHVTLRQASC
jgi:hypothetical protein